MAGEGSVALVPDRLRTIGDRAPHIRWLHLSVIEAVERRPDPGEKWRIHSRHLVTADKRAAYRFRKSSNALDRLRR
jgi:hypothetical protein